MKYAVWFVGLTCTFNTFAGLATFDLQGDATSWGAAVAAGVGVGLYDWSIAAGRSTVSHVVEPNSDVVPLYAELLEMYGEIYTALEPIYTRLHEQQQRV